MIFSRKQLSIMQLNLLIPPGSTFKPMTAIAGLEEGVIGENTTVVDGGPYNHRYPSVTAACWLYNEQGYGHGISKFKKGNERIL